MVPVFGAILLFLTSIISGPSTFAQAPIQAPYRKMLDKPLRYTGPESMSAVVSELDEIRIGLFAPGDPGNLVVREMIRGASLAVEEANRVGGYKGKPFRIVHRRVSDPWAAGSKAMIDLVYKDRVWAVVGGPSSDTTHIAEQVCTKARVPLLSPVSSDPSLTHIRIPWIFRLPPDLQIQAECLLSHPGVFEPKKRVGLLTSTDLEGRLAAIELKKAMEAKHIPPIFHFTVDPNSVDIPQIVSRIQSFNPDGLVLRLPAERLIELVLMFEQKKVSVDLFIPWIPELSGDPSFQTHKGNITQVLPYIPKNDYGPSISFQKLYERCFSNSPTPCTMFTYDAVKMIVQGIETVGLSRVGLRNAIAEMSGFEGAAGLYHWDNGGGSTMVPFVFSVGRIGKI